jgi:hypothetical protein
MGRTGAPGRSGRRWVRWTAARRDPAGGDVVTRHVDGQPTDAPDSAHDGVHVGNQDISPDPRQCHVLAESSAQDDVGIVSLREGKDTHLQDINESFDSVCLLSTGRLLHRGSDDHHRYVSVGQYAMARATQKQTR